MPVWRVGGLGGLTDKICYTEDEDVEYFRIKKLLELVKVCDLMGDRVGGGKSET